MVNTLKIGMGSLQAMHRQGCVPSVGSSDNNFDIFAEDVPRDLVLNYKLYLGALEELNKTLKKYDIGEIQ